MGSIIRIALYIIIFALVIVFINTDFVISDDNSSYQQSSDYNQEYVSVTDVFKELKEDLNSDKKKIKNIKNCKHKGNIEYVKENNYCRTSTEHIITCKDGIISIRNGLEGKELKINNKIFKCEDSVME